MTVDERKTTLYRFLGENHAMVSWLYNVANHGGDAWMSIAGH